MSQSNERSPNSLYHVDRGDWPRSYSPQIHAALAIFFAAEISGRCLSIEKLAETAGCSSEVLRHYIKGIRHKMRQIVEEGRLEI